MHCMVGWFMLKNALYLWTLRLQVRLDCVTFVSEHSVQMWLNRYVKKRVLSNKSWADFFSHCLSWIQLMRAREAAPVLINCSELLTGILEGEEVSSNEWFWPIVLYFLSFRSILPKLSFCVCSCTFPQRCWGLFIYFK